MMDPLLLAQSGVIYLTAPSVGFATAALYYLLTKQPRKFALAGFAGRSRVHPYVHLHLLPDRCCLKPARNLRRGLRADCLVSGSGIRVLLRGSLSIALGTATSSLIPASGRFSSAAPASILVHLKINLLEVFLPPPGVQHAIHHRHHLRWHRPARPVEDEPALPAPNPASARWYEQLGGDRALALLFVLIVGTIIYLPVITATSGLISAGAAT